MLSRVKMCDNPLTNYEILKISKNSSISEIKTAFKKLALIHHPDKGGDIDEFNKIQKAYQELTEPPLKTYGFESYNSADSFEDLLQNLNTFSNIFFIQKSKTVDVILTVHPFDILVEKTINISDYNLNIPFKLNRKYRDGHVLFLNSMGVKENNKLRGDVRITIFIVSKKILLIDNDIIYHHTINFEDSILGIEITIQNYNNTLLEIKQSGIIKNGERIVIENEGVDNGSFILLINVEYPEFDENQLSELYEFVKNIIRE